MAMHDMKSYDQNGQKLSFAEWIADLSRTETPFMSDIRSESCKNTKDSWQTDRIDSNRLTAGFLESSLAEDEVLKPTVTVDNYTQIFRRVARVSDTANAISTYGRAEELQYQLGKKGKEFNLDIEAAFLKNGDAVVGDATTPRTLGGFQSLVAKGKDADTGAEVTLTTAATTPAEEDIWGMTYNLYLAGSDADTIMVHPSQAAFFASLQELAGTQREHTFSNGDKTFVKQVTSITSPLGQTYKIVVNINMPEDAFYFYNSKDWTKRVLRPTSRYKLPKGGSSEAWAIEAEMTLRHRHPYASGVLLLKK